MSAETKRQIKSRVKHVASFHSPLFQSPSGNRSKYFQQCTEVIDAPDGIRKILLFDKRD